MHAIFNIKISTENSPDLYYSNYTHSLSELIL